MFTRPGDGGGYILSVDPKFGEPSAHVGPTASGERLREKPLSVRAELVHICETISDHL